MCKATSFQAALLAHPKFVSGEFNTGFIAEHYAEGFRVADVKHGDPAFLVALAAYLHRRYRARASGISGQLEGHGVKVGEQFVVVTLAADGQHEHTPVSVTDFHREAGASSVQVGNQSYRIVSRSPLGEIRIEGLVNDRPFLAQVERHWDKSPLALRILHDGAQIDAMVLSPLGAQLQQWMPYKAAPDLSRFLLSPMPGLLTKVAIAEGQPVQPGDKLAVIEAMKMENVLVAAREDVVSKLHAAEGDSVAVDQVIMEFR